MNLPWPLDLSGFYIKRKFLGNSVPLLASFKVTYSCNLACRACPFHQRAAQGNSHISWHTAVKLLEKLRRLGTRIVVFEGGEPMRWRDGSRNLNDLISYARNLFLRVAVTSNGTLPLNVCSHVLWVSLDGPKKTHDDLRSNSFDSVCKNIEEAEHPRIFIHCTLNRENWRSLADLAELVRTMPTVKGMTVQFFYPYGQGEDDLKLTLDERKAAVDILLNLKKKGFPILNSAGRLRAMVHNSWSCYDDILINVDPDGIITKGCYVKSRGKIDCGHCGFSPIAEASGALDFIPGSMYAGWKLFLKT